MNLLSGNGFKIEYTMRMDRFSASRENEWFGFSLTVLTVIVTIACIESKSERIIVHNMNLILK